jgi:nucleotide-binding universal stress UspA family protein
MSPFRTILFASDFSERSREAFRVACSLAADSTTRLFVVHVVEPGRATEEASVPAGPAANRPGPEAAQKRRDALLERLRACHVPGRPIDVSYHVREGVADEVILQMAGEVGADLIALGTHGRTGLPRLLAGSVAEAVLRKAQCPVLALRSTELGARVTQDIQGILHPTDQSEESRGALAVARALARDLGARLVVLHVALPVETVPGVIPYDVHLREEHDRLEALRKQLDGPDLKTPVEAMLRRGKIATEILCAARESGCDLIVMGTHGRTGLRRLLMGSVAEAVVRGGDCPVLVVRGAVPRPDPVLTVPGEMAR